MAVLVAALLAIFVAAADSPPFKVGPPTTIAEIDAGQLHGTPIQLGWSADSQRWYVETMEGEGPSAKFHYFVMGPGDKAPKALKDAPDWAAAYWGFKSNRAAPAHPDTMIQVAEVRRRTNMIPTESLAQKAAGTSNGGAAIQNSLNQAIDSANAASVQALTVDGTEISELSGEPLVPGETFGWSPKTLDAIAFRNEHRHGLSLYRLGHHGTLDVPDTKDILLPAWSPDGTRIVFLEQVGKKKYEVVQVAVSPV